MKNFYEILQVSPKATKDEIKKAFRILVKKYHPDTNINDKTLGAKFQEINGAYSVLSDEKLRREYDEKLVNSKRAKESNKDNGDANKKQSKPGEKNNDMKSAMDNLNNQFEQFFGFNANSNDVKGDFSSKKNNNPIDTSSIFESFFNAKKR